MYVCMYECMYVCMYVCKYVCKCVCKYVWVCVYTYTCIGICSSIFNIIQLKMYNQNIIIYIFVKREHKQLLWNWRLLLVFFTSSRHKLIRSLRSLHCALSVRIHANVILKKKEHSVEETR